MRKNYGDDAEREVQKDMSIVNIDEREELRALVKDMIKEGKIHSVKDFITDSEKIQKFHELEIKADKLAKLMNINLETKIDPMRLSGIIEFTADSFTIPPFDFTDEDRALFSELYENCSLFNIKPEVTISNQIMIRASFVYDLTL